MTGRLVDVSVKLPDDCHFWTFWWSLVIKRLMTVDLNRLVVVKGKLLDDRQY